MTTGIDLFTVEGTETIASGLGIAIALLGVVGIIASIVLVPVLISVWRKPLRRTCACLGIVAALGVSLFAISQSENPATKQIATHEDSWVIASGSIGWANAQSDEDGYTREVLVRLEGSEEWLLSFTRPDDVDRLIGRTGDVQAQCAVAGDYRLRCTTDITETGTRADLFGFFGLFEQDIEWGEPVASPLPAPGQ